MDVMTFVRRDGPRLASRVFLTIEDGGSFRDEAEFKEYFVPDNEIWHREAPSHCNLGKPGEIISKIVCALDHGSIDSWRTYRDSRLYVHGECNIKFYPIGRRNRLEWKPYFTALTGLTEAEYLAACRTGRHAILVERYAETLQNAETIIVLGALSEWLQVLLPLFPRASSDVASNGRWSIYRSPRKSAQFAYLNMFRRGLRNSDIVEFAAELRHRSANEYLQR